MAPLSNAAQGIKRWQTKTRLSLPCQCLEVDEWNQSEAEAAQRERERVRLSNDLKWQSRNKPQDVLEREPT